MSKETSPKVLKIRIFMCSFRFNKNFKRIKVPFVIFPCTNIMPARTRSQGRARSRVQSSKARARPKARSRFAGITQTSGGLTSAKQAELVKLVGKQELRELVEVSGGKVDTDDTKAELARKLKGTRAGLAIGAALGGGIGATIGLPIIMSPKMTKSQKVAALVNVMLSQMSAFAGAGGLIGSAVVEGRVRSDRKKAASAHKKK
jgi:hypothetical protein